MNLIRALTHPREYASNLFRRTVHWTREVWFLHELRKAQWLKRGVLESIQLKRLKELLVHAYYNVAFYHRLFDRANVKPGDIKRVEDLSKLPLTSKREVRENFPEGILARGVDVKRCVKHRTSGSTGERMVFLFDESARAFNKAVSLYPFIECGLKLSDRVAHIRGGARATPLIKESRDWFNRLGFMQRIFISPLAPFEEQIRALESFNPDVIYGYPSSLFLIAEALRDGRAKHITPRLVFSHGETLDDKVRHFINSTFAVEMYDTYGCSEAPRLAWECDEHVGYHICVTGSVVEFVDIDSGEHVAPGERGEIVITNLYNYAMPLIRYRIGDVGVPSEEMCPCGRTLPLMKSVEGRMDDFIIKPNGELISPRTFAGILWNISGVGKYRLVQEKPDEFYIELVEEKGFTEKTADLLKKEIEKVMGCSIKLEVKIVKDVPPENSGKLRKIVSKVSSRFS